MKIYIEGHNLIQPVFEIVRAVTGLSSAVTETPSDADVISRYDGAEVTTEILCDGIRYSDRRPVTTFVGRNSKQALTDTVKKSYYELACGIYEKKLPWGFMTGIRPTSIAKNYDNPLLMSQDFLTDENKASLAVTVKNNRPSIDPRSLGIYIGIPFCPTRCLYCSFVSLPMDKQKQYVEPYVDRLCHEIEYTGEKLKSCGRATNSVYIGGGTPTSLSAEQLGRIIDAVNTHIGDGFEFTVEAGRPDTITEAKLLAMKEGGVTRISINPQTLNDDILRNIGRCHNSTMFFNAYEMADKFGFKNINTDVIAGLPDETYDMFVSSLTRLAELSPASVTVHTMCVKRAASLTKGDISGSHAADMIDFSQKLLQGMDYIPYYMYRQKDSIDNLENTGYCKKGYECIYNLFMMEDMGSVIGIGAGSSSKAVFHESGRIERVFNLKDAHEYIKNFDVILSRKDKYFEILEEC